MNRRQYLLVMGLIAAAACGLIGWVSAFHNVRASGCTTSDRVISATVFWVAAIAPISLGLVLSRFGVSRAAKPHWPVAELAVPACLLLALAQWGPAGRCLGIAFSRIPYPFQMRLTCFLLSLSVALSMLNSCLGIRHRKWVRAGSSILVATAVILLAVFMNGISIYGLC
jgi:hypothetical protein